MYMNSDEGRVPDHFNSMVCDFGKMQVKEIDFYLYSNLLLLHIVQCTSLFSWPNSQQMATADNVDLTNQVKVKVIFLMHEKNSSLNSVASA